MISGILVADEVRDALVRRTICIQCPLCGQAHDVRIREGRLPEHSKAGWNHCAAELLRFRRQLGTKACLLWCKPKYRQCVRWTIERNVRTLA